MRLRLSYTGERTRKASETQVMLAGSSLLYATGFGLYPQTQTYELNCIILIFIKKENLLQTFSLFPE